MGVFGKYSKSRQEQPYAKRLPADPWAAGLRGERFQTGEYVRVDIPVVVFGHKRRFHLGKGRIIALREDNGNMLAVVRLMPWLSPGWNGSTVNCPGTWLTYIDREVGDVDVDH